MQGSTKRGPNKAATREPRAPRRQSECDPRHGEPSSTLLSVYRAMPAGRADAAVDELNDRALGPREHTCQRRAVPRRVLLAMPPPGECLSDKNEGD
jgi:hypothetical protein